MAETTLNNYAMSEQKPAKKITPLPFDLAAKEFFKKLAENEE